MRLFTIFSPQNFFLHLADRFGEAVIEVDGLRGIVLLGGDDEGVAAHFRGEATVMGVGGSAEEVAG
jgi:hypothetical protein